MTRIISEGETKMTLVVEICDVDLTRTRLKLKHNCVNVELSLRENLRKLFLRFHENKYWFNMLNIQIAKDLADP